MSADRTPDDFGSILRQARERRGLSLRHVAGATKISVAALEALEQNDLSRLPGGIFSRAFVRSYAVEVGLDPDKTIQQFITAFPSDVVAGAHAALSRADDNEAIESERRTAATFLRLIAFSVPIAIAVVYFATVGRRAPSASAPPAASAPAEAIGAPAAVSQALPPPQTAVPSAQPASPPAANNPPAASATPAVEQGSIDRLIVGLSVTRPCWLSATVDGQKTIERLFQPGEQRTVEVRRELVLTAGDASAVSLTLNGAGARPLGKTGEVITARVDLTNYKEYLSAR